MNTKTFIGIMIFYMIVSNILFPLLFYYLGKKTLASAGNGFIVGSFVTILLWVTVGRTL